MGTPMGILEWLAAQFDEPWLFPALLTILAAALGARHTLRANIREKAWQALYTQKHNDLKQLMQGIMRFRHALLAAGEVNFSRSNGSSAERVRTLAKWVSHYEENATAFE